MKAIRFSQHARLQMADRGAYEDEVVDTIRTGDPETAKAGRLGYRKGFRYNSTWGKRSYATKQVLVIVAEEPDALIVVAGYAFYF